MRLYCVSLLLISVVAGCVDEPAGPDSAPTSTAESEVKVLVPIPPPDGGPYDLCGVSLCVEGYVDSRIELDPGCSGGYRTFCVPCGDRPLPQCR